MPIGTVAPELALLGSAVAVLLAALALPRRLQILCAALTVAGLAGVGTVSAAQLRGGQTLTFFGTYAVDGAAVWTKLFLLATAAAAVLLSVERFRGDAREGEYYTVLLLATLGAVLLAGATDVMEIILGVLLTSIASYILVAYDRGSPRATEAAMKYFLFGALTGAGMLYGFALLFGLSGETLLGEMGTSLAPGPQPALGAGVALVVAGIGFKIGFVPVHFWVPDVFEGASSPVAAFVSVAPKLAGLVALGRFLVAVPADRVAWPMLVAVLAAATMTVGNLAAMPQTNIKRLLGYSTISQVGYMLMALVVLGRSPAALPALLYYFAAYAAANLGAFAVVTETGREEVDGYRGLARTRPGLALAMVVLLLSLVGIPPLAGFVAKLLVFEAAIDGGFAWLAGVAAANTVASLYYYVRVVAPMYLAEDEAAPAPVGPWALAVVAAAAVATVGLGIAAGTLTGPLSGAEMLPR